MPPALAARICDLAGEARIDDAQTAYGGYSASASYLITFSSGRRVFAKGTHPGEMSHGAENLRGEIRAYQSLPLLHSLAPRFIGLAALDESDDNGWMLGLWQAVDAAPLPPDAAPYRQALQLLQQSGAPDSLPQAQDHPYLRQFLNDEKKWKRLRDEPQTADKFTGLFAAPAQGAQWLRENVAALCALQAQNAAAIYTQGLMHGDLRCDNFLYDGARLYVIDWANAARGPLWFDRAFLGASCMMLGHAGAAMLFDEVPDAALAALAGYFADQAYRAVPPKMPRLRHMQRAMLAAFLQQLAARGAVTPPADLLAG